ncbi:MAG TPA: nucleotidyltransferase family protein [Candidatus Nanoarchaeia archaeon]|nr:nucleotidyltransferase family protein [Candidatus Nanoarchaeia archaeon]
MVEAIIMAGTNKRRPVKGEACKALIDYNGKPLVQPVIDAHLESAYVEKVYVVGPRNRFLKTLPGYIDLVTFVDEAKDRDDEGNGFAANLMKGLKARTSTYPYVHFSTCDIPRINSWSVERFISDARCLVEQNLERGIIVDYIQALVKLEEDLKFFKGFTKKHRSAVRFNDGDYRLSNFAYAHVGNMLQHAEAIRSSYNLRKGKETPIKTAVKVFGFWNLVKLSPMGNIFGKISRDEFIRYIAKRNGISIDIVVGAADIAADIDNDDEFEALK